MKVSKQINWSQFESGNDFIDIGEELNNIMSGTDRRAIDKSIANLEDCFTRNMLLYDSSVPAIQFLLISVERFFSEGEYLHAECVLEILVNIANCSHSKRDVNEKRNMEIINELGTLVNLFNKSNLKFVGLKYEFSGLDYLIDLIAKCGFWSVDHKLIGIDLFSQTRLKSGVLRLRIIIHISLVSLHFGYIMYVLKKL